MVLALDFLEEKKGNVMIIRMKGRLDAINALPAGAKLLDLVGRGEKEMLLDMSGVDYISSSGIRLLFVVAKKLKDNSGTLMICSARSTILEVFGIAGLDSAVKCFNSEAEAISDFQK